MLIRGYNIDNTRDWKIYKKGQFEATTKTNNFQKSPIIINREYTGTHSKARERTWAHG